MLKKSNCKNNCFNFNKRNLKIKTISYKNSDFNVKVSYKKQYGIRKFN